MQEQERRDFLSQLGRVLIEEGHPFRNYISRVPMPPPKSWRRRKDLMRVRGRAIPGVWPTIPGDSRGEIVKIGEELISLAKSSPPWSGNMDGEIEKEGSRLGKRLIEIGRQHYMEEVLLIGDCIVQLAVQPLEFLEQNRSNFDRRLKKAKPSKMAE